MMHTAMIQIVIHKYNHSVKGNHPWNPHLRDSGREVTRVDVGFQPGTSRVQPGYSRGQPGASRVPAGCQPGSSRVPAGSSRVSLGCTRVPAGSTPGRPGPPIRLPHAARVVAGARTGLRFSPRRHRCRCRLQELLPLSHEEEGGEAREWVSASLGQPRPAGA